MPLGEERTDYGASCPLITVMMPARNEDKYIGQAIESILGQSYRNWELVIVDDKSTDGTRAIVDYYARLDRRIRVIDGMGICSGNARNVAIDHARGEYVMNMDADDISAPCRVEMLLAEASKYRYAVVGSSLWITGADLTMRNLVRKPYSDADIRRAFRRVFGRDSIIAGTILTRTELLRQYRYNEFYRVMVDWDLILRLSEDERVVFRNVQEPVYTYRLNEGSMTLKPDIRVRYNLLVRYNEIRRRRGELEVRSLEEFERILGDTLFTRTIYGILIFAKRVQHYLFTLKFRVRKWSQ